MFDYQSLKYIVLELDPLICDRADQTVVSKNEHAVVVSAGDKPSSKWTADASRLMVQLDYRTIKRYLSELLGHAINDRIEFSLDLDTSEYLGRGIRDYVFFLAHQINENSYMQKNLLVRGEVEKTLINMLLNVQPNNYSDHILAHSVPGKPKSIARAYDYIMANFDKDVSIDDLLEISGVSLRSLHSGFRRYLGTSPMLALKTARLNAVRKLLLSDDSLSKSITYIAGIYGFDHMGNFSKDYFRQFDEKPSETRKLV
jgi:AraC-like DNA-binding protein